MLQHRIGEDKSDTISFGKEEMFEMDKNECETLGRPARTEKVSMER